MLRKYCVETARNLDEGIPFVGFAAHEAVQESLGFSPAALVFGRTPRGPLKSLGKVFVINFVISAQHTRFCQQIP